MKTRHLLLALMLLGAPALRAQFGSFGDVPIEITAESETRFSGGVAIAEKNVVIHYGTTSIYSDYAEYSPDTRDVLVIGNVRIYRDGLLFTSDRALYNLETKLLRTADLRGASYPFFFQGRSVSSMEGNAFQVNDAIITTSDSSKPDYHLKAKSARIYPGDHVVLSNVQLYVGTTPVFWFPYVYQSLKRNEGFNFTPGYESDWGTYLLMQYGFPLSENLHGLAHLDLRSARGVGAGFDVLGNYGTNNKSWVRFKSYYAHDAGADINPSAVHRDIPSMERYRLSFQDRTFFTDTIYASADINKLSDKEFLRDFYPHEYSTNPQPDNVVSLTKRSENYTLTGILRPQFNNFFDTTERLPEIVLDVKRQPLFGSRVFYEGETSVVRLKRDFSDGDSPLQTDYSSTRFDTFHQFVAPHTFAGWLSVVPRIGFRGTYYSSAADSVYEDLLSTVNAQNLDLNRDADRLYQKETGSPVFRPVFNAGVESSFKFSKEWEKVQSRAWGLDGLRHIVQPYTNFSYVRTTKQPDHILQFDRLNPSTELPPLDFPQFTTLDTIPNWSVVRLGVRNRLQTRRDDRTINWLEMDTYFNANIDSPDFPGAEADGGSFSNVYNNITWIPLPWVSLALDSQLPLLDSGFTQVNTSVNFLVSRDLRLTVSHRYLEGNPYFLDSSNIRFKAYYRLNDNWGFSFSEQYEVQDHTLEVQDYELHRDLSSWVASLGFQVRDNHNVSTGKDVTNLSVIFTLTLKDLPSITLPVAFDPSSSLSGSED